MLNPYGDDVEVWRCSAESQDVDEPSWHVIQEAKPTVRQLVASAAAAKYGTSPSRGNFLPWSHIQGAGLTRFSFPFLGVATSREIHIWDIRTGVLVQTMLEIQQANYIYGDAILSADDEEISHPGDVNDMGLTESYVFVCGTDSFRVFDRSGQEFMGIMGPVRAVSVEDRAPDDAFGKWCFTVATDDSGEVIEKPHTEGALVVEHETVLLGARRKGNVNFLAGECLDGYAVDVFCRTRFR